MPAPGAQHDAIIPNPFAEEKPAISAYTAQEIATLQSRLERQLGPEYISSRAGPSGQKVHYLAAEKCIQLANEVFGFNGWSSSIRELQVDFVDENPTTGKVSLGLSVIVRVTLRDGTFHEDIGYGHMENCKGKAAAFEKAKKEGTTDGLKRALRNFGNVLGNCIYDKEYLAKVTKVKAAPSSKWDVDELHRHSTYAPIKKEPEPTVPEKSLVPVPDLPNGESIDEFGDFDAADFASTHDQDSHPDEVMLPASEHPNNIGANIAPYQNANSTKNPEKSRAQAMQAPPRLNNGLQTSAGLNKAPLAPQPHTPKGGLSRSNCSAGSNIPSRTANESAATVHAKPQKFFAVRVGRVAGIYENWGAANEQTSGFPGAESKSCSSLQLAEAFLAERDISSAAKGPQNVPSQTARSLNASKSNPSSNQVSPSKQQTEVSEAMGSSPSFAMPAEAEAPGFFSARAVQKLPLNTDETITFAGAHMRFDPKAESPSIRKTPGIDHNSTRPTTRDLKHVIGSTQGAQSPASASNLRPNITNPHLDATRKVGVPGSPSPRGNQNNRGQYKPPTMMKRPAEGGDMRAPLNDKNPNGSVQVDGGDVKRQRVNGP